MHQRMTPIEQAARLLCRASGDADDDLVSGYRSDAPNVWRFMIDALHQDAAHAADQTR